MDSSQRVLIPISDAFEQAPCGLLSTATDGTILRVNGTFCRWTGFAAVELLDQRRIQDLLTMGGKVFHQTHWAPLLQMQRSVAEVKLEIRHRDGHKVPMLINAVRHRQGDSEYDDFACMLVMDRHAYEQELLRVRQQAQRALDEKTVAEEALRCADRRKDEFVATIAHELRNPLAPIQAAARLFARQNFSDPRLAWSCKVRDRQAIQLARLVGDLLDVSRVAEGKLEIKVEHVDLTLVVRQASEGSRGTLEGAGHLFIVDLPAQPLFVDADAGRLIQIIENLLINAAKYTPEGGTIQLSVRRDERSATIVVQDTGIGITTEDLPSIFGIFTQLSSGQSRSQGGLGIGRSLVRALTERHGGRVGVSSDGPNKGSEFTVQLPLSPVQSANPIALSPSYKPASSICRVLIVDDNEDAALSLATLLDMDGHNAHTVNNGAKALEIIDIFLPDVMVIDIGLPDMSGYELASRIKQLSAEKRILLIALTGRSEEKDRQAASDAGFHHFMTKPLLYKTFLELL
ncbi:PAS domain S-box-containing protein [Paraburkholderia fungorum]|uniref:histidine kinase n=1 Tax=Paraburkholderia fungorum TaxID=134537 RepID=A0A1H1JYB8_9BURK|nr:ATP-binding protein [Paraburkholderia fungorum]SDR55023.1 PAS domain S-box-containing protein [Paraburkholderia fungorum]